MYNVTTFTDNTELTESLDVLSNTHICLKLASPKHCPRLLRVHVVIWCLFGQAKLMATQQERDMAISKLRKCQEELEKLRLYYKWGLIYVDDKIQLIIILIIITRYLRYSRNMKILNIW